MAGLRRDKRLRVQSAGEPFKETSSVGSYEVNEDAQLIVSIISTSYVEKIRSLIKKNIFILPMLPETRKFGYWIKYI